MTVTEQLEPYAKVSTAALAEIVGRDVDTVNHHIKTLVKQKRLDRKRRPALWSLAEAEIIIQHCSKNTRKNLMRCQSA